MYLIDWNALRGEGRLGAGGGSQQCVVCSSGSCGDGERPIGTTGGAPWLVGSVGSPCVAGSSPDRMEMLCNEQMPFLTALQTKGEKKERGNL